MTLKLKWENDWAVKAGLYYKVVYVFPMVTVSVLLQAEFGLSFYWKDAPVFIGDCEGAASRILCSGIIMIRIILGLANNPNHDRCDLSSLENKS